ncbi:MAG: hypothetical protein H6Q80_548 [Deltaproteobacteria bacterium]|nr:hypothetical protein [Deltaproteobacteria bacterium]
MPVRLHALLLLAAVLAACSPKAYVVSRAADALSSSGDAFARDDDPDLVRGAAPFPLKAMESLLAEQPENRALLTALSRGFTQFTVAFVRQDAEEESDPLLRRAGMERAGRLLLRAKEYGVRGLSVGRQGFAERLESDPAAAAAQTGEGDVPLLFWTAASWTLAMTSTPDAPALLADLPRCEALMRRALALDEAFDGGAIHEYFIAFEGGRPEAMGGSAKRALRHFERAMEISGGRKVSPLVTYAETVSVRVQNRKEFLDLLDQALAFDARGTAPEYRLANLVAQRRARWLKGRVDDLFVE